MELEGPAGLMELLTDDEVIQPNSPPKNVHPIERPRPPRGFSFCVMIVHKAAWQKQK
jgi:hypothetical protein